MLVTLFGIVTDVRPEQPKNAPSPMLVTLFGIVIDVRPQSENANLPMLVTLLGIVTDVRRKQPEYLQLIVYQFVSIKTVEK